MKVNTFFITLKDYFGKTHIKRQK